MPLLRVVGAVEQKGSGTRLYLHRKQVNMESGQQLDTGHMQTSSAFGLLPTITLVLHPVAPTVMSDSKVRCSFSIQTEVVSSISLVAPL